MQIKENLEQGSDENQIPYPSEVDPDLEPDALSEFLELFEKEKNKDLKKKKDGNTEQRAASGGEDLSRTSGVVSERNFKLMAIFGKNSAEDNNYILGWHY